MIEEKNIKSCVKAIKKRLKDKRINLACNYSVKSGYIKSLEILNKRITNFQDAGIESLTTVQARAIAFLAVDFLNEECTESILTNVPIKDK